MNAVLPVLFADMDFLNSVREEVATYVNLRVRGYYSIDALRIAFGQDNCDQNAMLRVDYLESTKHYIRSFDEALKVIPTDQILNEKMALREYMTVYRNPFQKGSVRVAALKEASVLAGITVIDDKGNTKRMPNLSELYAALEKKPNPDGDNPNALH